MHTFGLLFCVLNFLLYIVLYYSSNFHPFRSSHVPLYLRMDSDDDGSEEVDPDKIGYLSCVTKFIRMLLSLMEHGAKTHLKHLTEYFALLLEFSKMGEEECQFLISINAISTMVNFYLGQKSHEYVRGVITVFIIMSLQINILYVICFAYFSFSG